MKNKMDSINRYLNSYIFIDRILAVGCYKRFMFIKTINSEDAFCVRISKELYEHLKSLGCYTSQELRYKRVKAENG